MNPRPSGSEPTSGSRGKLRQRSVIRTSPCVSLMAAVDRSNVRRVHSTMSNADAALNSPRHRDHARLDGRLPQRASQPTAHVGEASERGADGYRGGDSITHEDRGYACVTTWPPYVPRDRIAV